MVINACTMFKCAHKFVALPGGAGFACINCDHFRPELELDQRKSLLFFPIPATDVEPVIELS